MLRRFGSGKRWGKNPKLSELEFARITRLFSLLVFRFPGSRLSYFAWDGMVLLDARNDWFLRILARQLIEQDYIEQRLVYLDTAVVAHETELAKAVHKEADTGTRGADHICQSFLSNGRDGSVRFTRLAEFRHQKKNPRQAFFAGVEELIDKICLGSHATSKQELEEYIGECSLLM